MKHKFQPILSAQNYTEAISYIVDESRELCQKLLGKSLPIDTIAIFAHSDEEYEFIKNLLSRKGPVSPYSHGTTLYIEASANVSDQNIKLLGVRQPDSSRPERGYADFPVADPDRFKSRPFIKEIVSGRGEPLLELHHPDFEVRGYIVKRLW